MRLRGLLILASIALCLTGCNRQKSADPFWVKGLTLPPGSTNVQAGPGGGKKSTIIGAYFDNPDGWDAVVNHFEMQLTKQGYARVTLPSTVSSIDSIMWSKPGSPFFVTVTSQSQLMAIQASKGRKLSPEFWLEVMKH